MFCSPDGKFLVSLGSGGPGRVWDLTSSTVVASLPKENVRNNFVITILRPPYHDPTYCGYEYGRNENISQISLAFTISCFWANWILLETFRMRLLGSADFLTLMMKIKFCISLQLEVNIQFWMTFFIFRINFFFFLLTVLWVKYYGPFLYTDQGASIVTWNTTTWRKLGSKQIVRDSISAFSVSADGKFLAVYASSPFYSQLLKEI